jgi:Uma2 family endonuclease
VDDYYTVEEMSEVKHEYWNGDIFAMAGASLAHNEISANVLSEMRARLRNTSCGAYGSDLRVQTPTGLYTYPDVSVICGRVQLLPGRSDTAVNPVILVEVLSDATEEYYRGDKFTMYKSIEVLTHYILIAQTGPRVDHFERNPQGVWQLRSIESREHAIRIAEPFLEIPLAEIYRRVV